MIENGFRVYQGLGGLAIDQLVDGMVYPLVPSQSDYNLPLGYYDDDFNLIAGDEPFEKYDPDQLRAPEGTDIGGQWVDDPNLPTVVQGDPWSRRFREVIDQLPAEHMLAIKDTTIRVVKHLAAHTTPDGRKAGYTLGQWSTGPFWPKGLIEIAKGYNFGAKQVPLRNPNGTLVHEIGHAVDHAFPSSRISSNAYLMQSLAHDALTLTKVNKRQMRNAAYWLTDPREMFAELYALTYTPRSTRQTGKFFGMKAEFATKKFARSINVMKNILKDRFGAA